MAEKRPSPSPYGATLRALVQAAICMGIYLYLVPYFPLSRFTNPIYQEWGFWKRFGYQYMSGFTARWKYYFIWSISEASIIISGLGFSGWSDTAPPKPKWDRAKNVDVLGVEFAKSAVELPLVWNIQVSSWLRYCKFLLSHPDNLILLSSVSLVVCLSNGNSWHTCVKPNFFVILEVCQCPNI